MTTQKEPDPTTQCGMVLAHIREHGSVTPKEAMAFGCYRLAARVMDLREDGWAIVTEREEHEGGEHARYRLKVRDSELEAQGQLAMGLL